MEQAPFHEMNAEGLVCRVMYRDWAGGGRLAPLLQVIVPEELRNRIVAAYHEDKNAHPSAIRTFQAVSQKFYWPGMLADIRRYLKYCPVCQYDKKLQSKLANGRFPDVEAKRGTGNEIDGDHTNGGRSPQFATSRHVTPIGRHVTRRGKKRAPECKADGHPS